MSPTFHSLAIRNYRLYFSGGVVSNIGTWMQRVAQDWLILQLTGSATALGITTGLQFLPFLLFSMWGGAIADRYSKRRVLVTTQALMGGLALLLGALDLTGMVAAWHVYALAFAMGCVVSFDNPARQAFTAELVGPDAVPNAVGLNSSSFNLARLVGPAVAGVLIAATGTGPVFVLNALSFGAVIVVLLLMRGDELMPAPRSPRERGQLRAALHYVRTTPELLLITLIAFFVGTFGFNFQLTLAIFAKNEFGRGPESFGLLSSALAIGTLAGALLAARRGRPTLQLVVGAALLFGLLEILTALAPTYWTFLLMLIPTGLASLTLLTAMNSSMQLGSVPQMRGRVMALYMTVFMGGTPIGSPMVGWVAQEIGPRWSLIGGGLVSVLATVIATLWIARRTGIDVRERVTALRQRAVLRPFRYGALALSRLPARGR
ncbi:MAG TPA: MFS transporter [Actinomycetes bacterium]|nr:MFS transporter [Actinomycetes bacterium]